MLTLIDCEDPRGIRIVLTEDCFYGHIRSGHYDITVDDIKLCLANPTAITYRPSYPHRHLYHLKGRFGNNRDLVIAKIVVDTQPNPACVVTAYLYGHPSKEEIKLWPVP